MKTTVSLHHFRDEFSAFGRADQFSHEGLVVLFEYLEQYEEGTGEELELDVIALCCDFYEDTVEAIADNYSVDLTDCEDEDAQASKVREYLEDNGAYVGKVAGGFVYRYF